jgi:hypothetical protein
MRVMKVLALAVLCGISIIDGSSQEIRHPKNSLYLELLGSGGIYSVNYERQVLSNFYGRAGMAVFKEFEFISDSKNTITSFPVMIGYLSGKGKSHFEISGGLLFGNKQDSGTKHKILDLIGFIGYRYRKPEGALVFRAGITPFYSLDNDANYSDEGYFPSVRVSIGLRF